MNKGFQSLENVQHNVYHALQCLDTNITCDQYEKRNNISSKLIIYILN